MTSPNKKTTTPYYKWELRYPTSRALTRTETSSCWATSQERSSCSISNPRTAPHGCTGEACDMRDNYERFLALGYEVVGVSRDSAASHQHFRAKCQMPFHHISDPDHLILEAYEA